MPRFPHTLLAVFSFALPAGAQELVFRPSADAPVREDARDSNHATSDLLVQRDDYSAGSRWKRSYLRFDVAGLAAAPACITLELTEGEGSAGDAHFEVRSVDAGWSETALTWNNAPNLGGRRIGAYTGPRLGEGQTVRVPLDPAWITQDGTYALALIELRSGGLNQSAFQSREDWGAPRLVLGCASLPPLAGFTSRDHEGAVPFTPELLNASPGDATAWLWDFGDGTSSTARNPVHTYLVPGRYTVSLSVTRPGGTATCTRPGMFLAYPADRARGSVLGWSKISNTTGGQSPPLRANDMFGRSCTGIGDVDGDGVVDLAVGAIGEDRPGSNAGAVWILFPRRDGTVRDFVKITEGLSGFGGDLDVEDGFGRESAAIGDWDLDGVPDLAIGANRDDDGGANRGAIYLCCLNRDGTVKSWRKLSHASGLPFGLRDGDEFGRGVARLEDMDGDGVPELAVGAIGDDDGNWSNGAVWILFMRRDGTARAYAKLSATSGGIQSPFVRSRGGTWFGMHVAALGDLDGNGVTDLGVGALLDDGEPHASGGLFVIRLDRNGRSIGDRLVNADAGGLVAGELEANDEFGGAVAGLGDVDGDGIPDVACSAIRDDDNGVRDTELVGDWGAIYVLFLRADGSVREYQKISATRGGFAAGLGKYDRLGEGLGAIGDFNGDGVPDLVAGSRFDDSGGSNKGAVYLLYLNDGTRFPPRPDFAAAPTSGDVPLSVDFTDLTSGDVTSWSWDFGDGASSTVASPSHAYAAPGKYTVALRASGPSGSALKSVVNLITVLDPGAGGSITPLGCGVNPAGSFQVLSGAPRLGSTLVFGLDNPLGTQNAGAVPYVFASYTPDALSPCGSLRAGMGMAGPGASGELLLDPTAPLFRKVSGAPWTAPGVPASVSFRIPASRALLGVSLYLQGRLVDGAPGAPVRLGLTDGVKITIGS
jgi:PKD repeat protein